MMWPEYPSGVVTWLHPPSCRLIFTGVPIRAWLTCSEEWEGCALIDATDSLTSPHEYEGPSAVLLSGDCC